MLFICAVILRNGNRGVVSDDFSVLCLVFYFLFFFVASLQARTTTLDDEYNELRPGEEEDIITRHVAVARSQVREKKTAAFSHSSLDFWQSLVDTALLNRSPIVLRSHCHFIRRLDRANEISTGGWLPLESVHVCLFCQLPITQ